MTDQFSVQTDGVRNYAQTHSDVNSGLVGLPALDGTGVNNSHGAIAASVSTALGSALTGRGGAMGATSTSASTISDLLQQAARAYAGGDEEGGRRLRAAADALDGRQPGAAGAGAAGAAGAGGADAMGQMGQIMGQVGQQVGQLAQSVTAPLQGLAQGLQQVPQQIMQGVQQAVQAAGGAGAASGAAGGAGVKLPSGDELKDAEKAVSENAEKTGAEPTERRETGERSDDTEARGGQDGFGRAPVEAPAPAQPAPTRPQVD
ncbi:MAG: type VII secretion target [Mycolicibacterium neoaurum]|uniref:type VII secretion target n=1 Tax=Mycolicibacterium neoaurum TaxID=1795 RepID=UPI002FF8BB62